MSETPEQAYERVLAEEQGKGSSPTVAQARAKAARMRASKGLPTDPAAAAKAAAAGEAKPAPAPPPPAAEAPPPPAAEAPPPPAAEAPPAAAAAAPPPAAAAAAPAGVSAAEADAVFEKVLAEEQAKGSSPAVAQARAKAARMRALKGGAGAARPAAAAPAAPAAAASTAPAAAAAAPPATATAATAGAPRGRGAAARAARAAGAGGAVPERIQRLLAVVRPEAIQRVEREPVDRVNAWPHLMAGEFLALLVVTVFLLIFSTMVNATFRELANVNVTPRVSKAPWYFLGLQELLRYFHPQVAGVLIPQWIILGLIAAPFIDRNPSTKPNDRKLAIVMFSIFLLFFALLVITGSLFRGPGFNFVYPWHIPVGQIFEL